MSATEASDIAETIAPEKGLPTDPLDPVQEAGEWLWSSYEVAASWFGAHWFELVLAALAALIIYLIISAVRRWASRQARKREPEIDLITVAFRVVGRTGRFFRIMLSLVLVAGYTPMPATLYRIVAFLFTVAAAFQVAIWVREIVMGWVERRTHEEGMRNETLENAMTLIRILVNVAVFSIALIVILDNLGVDVTGLIAGLGVGGIAIGLAAQGIFSDLFAALSIIFDKPFRRGEVVSFDNMTATVEKIGLKSTRLRALDGQEVIISNTDLLAKQIENMTKLERRRAYLFIGVIYQTTPDQLKALPDRLRGIVEANGGTLIRAGLVGFGASSIDFELVFDSPSPDFMEMFAMRQAVALDTVKLFEAEGYEFAYPTQTTFTAAPDGEMVMPYPQVQPFVQVSSDETGTDAKAQRPE